jgi:hypothetical protein
MAHQPQIRVRCWFYFANNLEPRSHEQDPIPAELEVVALGPSGSLLVRDARLFHAGGRNTTTACRRSALVFYAHDVPEPEF